MAEKKLIKRPAKLPPKKIAKSDDGDSKSTFNDTVNTLNKLTMPAPTPILPPGQSIKPQTAQGATPAPKTAPAPTSNSAIAPPPAPQATAPVQPKPIQANKPNPANIPNNSAVNKPPVPPKQTGEASGQPVMNFYFGSAGLKY